MTLAELLDPKLLIAFRLSEEPSTDGRPLQFYKENPPVYSLRLNVNNLYPVIADEQKREITIDNTGTALLHSIDECFFDPLVYHANNDEEGKYKVVFVDDEPNPLPIAFANYNEAGDTLISCASNVYEFLQHNLHTILTNVEPMIRILQGHKASLTQVSRMSARDLLSGKVSFPEIPRPDEFDSLEAYTSDYRDEIRIGDKISGVELTGVHKKSRAGTFTLPRNIRVIVEGTSKDNTANVEITEKINKGMYRAIQYK